MSGTNTWTDLMNQINASSLGVQATFNTAADGTAGDGGLVLTSNNNGAFTITPGGAGLTVNGHAIAIDGTSALKQTGVAGDSFGTDSTAVLQLQGGGDMTDGSDQLGGAITINYNSASQTFIMGSNPGGAQHVPNAIYTGGTSVASLVAAINSNAMGGQVNALYAKGVSAEDTNQGTTGGIYLQGASGVASQFTTTTINPALGLSTPLAVTTTLVDAANSNLATGTGTLAATGVSAVKAALNVTANGTQIATSDVMAGSVTVTNGGITDIFNVGTGSDSYSAGVGGPSTPTTPTPRSARAFPAQ